MTLAGDAAHPMTPCEILPIVVDFTMLMQVLLDRGQGLNHCVADVASLVKSLIEMKDKKDLMDLVSRYEAEMIPRGKAEVESSVENANALHDWDLIMNSAMMKHGAVKTN